MLKHRHYIKQKLFIFTIWLVNKFSKKLKVGFLYWVEVVTNIFYVFYAIGIQIGKVFLENSGNNITYLNK